MWGIGGSVGHRGKCGAQGEVWVIGGSVGHRGKCGS